MFFPAEQIRRYPEYKVISSYLKKKYPFVLGVELTPDYRDYDGILFLSLVVDFDKLFNEYLNVPKEQIDFFTLNKRINLGLKDLGGNIHIPDVSFILSYDDSLEQFQDILKDINKALQKIRDSDAMTREDIIPTYIKTSIQDFSFPLNTYKRNAQ